MNKGKQTSFIWKILRTLNPRMARNYQRGFGPRRAVLLLTTTGRKSGLPRITPLQFEQVGEDFYVASARGTQADWYRNLQKNPTTRFQVGNAEWQGQAELVREPARIADFLEYRLKRRPFFIGLLLHLEGLPIRWKRTDMESLAAKKVLVILHPQ